MMKGSGPEPFLHAAWTMPIRPIRKTYFDHGEISINWNRRSLGDTGKYRVYLVDITGKVALKADLSQTTPSGEERLGFRADELSPGMYFLLLASRSSGGKPICCACNIYIFADDREDRLGARNYLHSPLPLTNHLGDIDRVLDSFATGHYNSLMRTSWGRETSAAQITDDYKLLPYHLLHADLLGLHHMVADIELLSVGAAPEARNPRMASKGTMEYALTE